MNAEDTGSPLISILKILLAMSFILIPTIINVMAKRKKERSKLTPSYDKKPKQPVKTIKKPVILPAETSAGQTEHVSKRLVISEFKPHFKEREKLKIGITKRELSILDDSIPDSQLENAYDTQVYSSALRDKLKNLSNNDLRYAIVINEIIGPPVSLK